MANWKFRVLTGLIALSISPAVHAAECTLEGMHTLADAQLDTLSKAGVTIPRIDKAQSERYIKLTSEFGKKYLTEGKVPQGSEFMQTNEYNAWSAVVDIEEARKAVTSMRELSDDSTLKDFIKSAVTTLVKLDEAYYSWQHWYEHEDAPVINGDYSGRIYNGFTFGIGITEILIKNCVDEIP